MRMATCAAHLGADHSVGVVLHELYSLRRDRLGEARPAGARVVLRLAVEECAATGGAMVEVLSLGEGEIVLVVGSGRYEFVGKLAR